MYIDGAFDALALQIAAKGVWFINAAAITDVVGVAAAASIEARPALHAGWLGENVGLLEAFGNFWFYNAGVDGAHLVILFAHKLVARIKVAFWTDGQIVMTATTAAQALWQTWAAGKVYVKVEEVVALAFAPTFDVVVGEDVVVF